MRARTRACLSDDRGFTMVHVMVVMAAVMGMSVAAFAAAGGDIRIGAYDRETKQAYAAAEAGIADYMNRLNVDNAYWRLCANVNTPDKVPVHIGQRWNGTGSDPRTWRALDAGRTGRTVQYTIELLPANGAASCDPAQANQTMLDTDVDGAGPDTGTGAFRIRATGRVRRGSVTEAKRSVIATFKRTSFLEFLYFTDKETSDPAVYQVNSWGKQTIGGTPPNGDGANSTLEAWASSQCDAYRRDGRGNREWWDSPADSDTDDDDGWIYWPSSGSDNQPWKSWGGPQRGRCSEIQFIQGDRVNGPLHTNDELLACGSPIFGRPGKNDKIEVSSPTAWRASCSGATPVFNTSNGQATSSSRTLNLPPDNKRLKDVVQPGYLFTGKTTIVLGSNTMTVNGASKSYPSNGVIYVENGTCGSAYRPLAPDSSPTGCGDAIVSGIYNKDLTIGARNDIVINGDLKRATTNPLPDVTLGLIANNFVRVAHPISAGPNTSVAYPPSGNPTCTNVGAANTQNRTIEAAILAIQHSFIVDHYYCGEPLGTLSVFGVIAQKFRGAVGTGNGTTASTGYLKNYNYDDRLSLRQPPYFLDPVQSAWRLRRQTEQTPPR